MAYDGGTDPTLADLINRHFVPEMFSRDIIEHTKSNLVCVAAFNTDFQDELKKGYKVSIPVTTEPSSTEVTPGTEPTPEDCSTTGAEITVDQWYESSANISPLIKIEQLADYFSSAAKSCAYAIDKKIDTTVGALFSTLNSSSVYGADGQTFTDDIFRALVQGLDESDVPDDNRCLIGDPSMKSDLMDIDKFVRSDYVGKGAVTNGRFGDLYNATVYITNNLTAASTGNYGVYAHKDAIGVVIQKKPNVNYWNLGWKFEHLVIADAAWGVAELRDSFGYPFYTRSS